MTDPRHQAGTDGVVRPPAAEYVRRAKEHATHLSDGLSATEVLEVAQARYQRDPLAHMRAELAVRVVDTQAGAQAVDEADYRTLIRAGAIVALELDARHYGAPDHARDVAAGLMAAALANAGAPDAVNLAHELIEGLERAGLAVTRR